MENPKLLFGDVHMARNFRQTTMKNALSFDDWLWPKGVIPIEIDPKLKSKTSMIIASLNHYHENTCLRFKKRTKERDYINFIFDDGCYSSIGRIGGRQVISLGEGCYCLGTIIHEVMHALGFWHEQNRSDRDQFIEILRQNIRPEALDQFVVLNESENRLLTPYDYYSIMQYPRNAFSIRVDLDTMRPKKAGVVLRHACESNKLSPLDILKIQTLYKCAS
jgi:hypothetical protein